MAVLTPITRDDAQALADAYGLGVVRAVEEIPAGSVNSNFALDLPGGRVFLRLYEEQDRAGAGRETSMLERIAAAGVPTPAPLRRTDGALVAAVRGKPAALFPWRSGAMRCQASVTVDDARQVGEALARVHIAAAGETATPGRFRHEDLLGRVAVIAGASDARLAALAPELRSWLNEAHAARDRSLPGGLTHGDLFRDNVLWDGEGRLAALLDFESACSGTYAYDLMVTILAWCVGDGIDARLATAMREGYEARRPLSEAERRGLHAEGSFAALRFTVTRITDYAMRTEAAGPRIVKDWRRFQMRFDRLRELGSAGVLRSVGLPPHAPS
jgi:homoserine kinase type II